MEKPESKSVEMAGSRDKHATFIIDLARNVLLIKLIYMGKTGRSLPKLDFS